MEINLQNIKTKKFTEERKGYKKDEVSSYLSVLADEFEKNIEKINILEDQVNELNVNLEEYRKIDEELRNTLISLNEPLNNSIVKAKDKAFVIIEEAEKKGEEIIYNVEEEAKSTRDTLLFLKEQQEIFVARLKIMIDSQEGMLNEFNDGNDTASLKKTMAEAAAFKQNVELNIDAILEKLL